MSAAYKKVSADLWRTDPFVRKSVLHATIKESHELRRVLNRTNGLLKYTESGVLGTGRSFPSAARGQL